MRPSRPGLDELAQRLDGVGDGGEGVFVQSSQAGNEPRGAPRAHEPENALRLLGQLDADAPAVSAGTGRAPDETRPLESGDMPRHGRRRHAFSRRELPHANSRRTADGHEQCHLAAGHAEWMYLAPELAGKLEENGPQPVCDRERIDGDGGRRQVVNQVNKIVASARGWLPCLCEDVATITRRQKSLTLIRAREVATNLALPIVVLDPEGTIVFYNEAAEAILGDTFESAGELSSQQWAAAFCPEREDGTPIPLHEVPGAVALLERRPHHLNLFYTGIDGVRRNVAVTAFPLVGREGELFGAFTIFWHI
jgi:PAS domain-containing protein